MNKYICLIIENNLSWNENFKALMKKKSEYQNAAALKGLEFWLQQRRNGKTVGDFFVYWTNLESFGIVDWRKKTDQTLKEPKRPS